MTRVPTVRRRLDAEMVRRRMVASRELAQRAITERRVLVAGALADRSSRLTAPDEPVELQGDGPRYVSRGGDKLETALVAFAIDPTGKDVLDVGASTGGFTDCLLQHGAARVVALDVGHGQLHERLVADRRVERHEKSNARHETRESLNAPDGGFPLITADLSFISLRTVSENLVTLAAEQADLVLLVKPQFEVGRAEASRGRGVITDPALHERAVGEVVAAYATLGARHLATITSPLKGAEGNVELFVHLRNRD